MKRKNIEHIYRYIYAAKFITNDIAAKFFTNMFLSDSIRNYKVQ